jgi:hypothetical protein
MTSGRPFFSGDRRSISEVAGVGPQFGENVEQLGEPVGCEAEGLEDLAVDRLGRPQGDASAPRSARR